MSDTNHRLDFAKSKKRIYDQTASMHFCLSDHYKTLSTIEDSFEILISVVLCGLTFFDFQNYFPKSSINSILAIGIVSILLFAFTLIKQRLGHKQLAEKHNLAGKMYSKAKLTLSGKIEEWKESDLPEKEIQDYILNHFQSLNDLPQIPEKKFHKLKHHHQSKVEFSKFLDSHPNDFWIICKIKYRFCFKQKCEVGANKQ